MTSLTSGVEVHPLCVSHELWRGIERAASANVSANVGTNVGTNANVIAPFRGPRRFRLEEPEGGFGLWLCEFRDDSTGGSSPPPLS